MNDTSPSPQNHRPRRHKEFDDPQYHDDEQYVRNDEYRQHRPGQSKPQQKTKRKFPSRRRYEE